MKLRYFGTDGIRSAVDGPLLEKGFVRRVGAGLGLYLARQNDAKQLQVVLGRDTRNSGSAITSWLMEGLATQGVRVFDVGVVPTPAVALAVQELKADMGVVVTASHNPATDNGIKVFGPGGIKLTEAEEVAVEAAIDRASDISPGESPDSSSTLGFDARQHYIQFMQSLLPENSLRGMKIAVDCANGATSGTSCDVLEALGADVFRLNCTPDGDNINDGCGSEHPEKLIEAVRENQAFLGVAHDGDGDRLVVVDDRGEILNGDELLGLIGLSLHRRGRLRGRPIVATVMSNQGLEAALAAEGVALVRVPVGDRNVLHRMVAEESVFGGEASGHLIFRDFLPTGDGLLAAIQVLEILVEERRPLSQLRGKVRLFPHRLVNLKVREKPLLESVPGLGARLAEIEQELGTRGRILLRYSGTEAKIRLLAEAESDERVEHALAQLQAVVADCLPLEDNP